MENKRGQGMSTNTIILLILGIVVLVVLILGFTMGWNKIAPWISGNNVDTIVAACEASCATNSVYDFCVVGRNLKADDGKLKDVTCNYLSNNQPKYGVGACSSVSCDNVAVVEATAETDLPNFCSGNEGKVIQALIENALVSYQCALA